MYCWANVFSSKWILEQVNFRANEFSSKCYFEQVYFCANVFSGKCIFELMYFRNNAISAKTFSNKPNFDSMHFYPILFSFKFCFCKLIFVLMTFRWKKILTNINLGKCFFVNTVVLSRWYAYYPRGFFRWYVTNFVVSRENEFKLLFNRHKLFSRRQQHC